MDLKTFSETARSLARNPLGIIALFIVLVYGIAGLVLGLSAKSLPENQTFVLVWFLALFPCVVLAAFVWLVANHHSKLYAPTDFRTDASFLESLSPETQKLRLETEAAALEVEDSAHEQSADTVTLVPQEKRPKFPRPASVFSEELKASVVLAEDLALREVGQEFGVSVSRQVGFAGVAFDGVFSYEGRGYGVEVKYSRGTRLSVAAITQRVEAAAASVARLGWRNFGIVLALVLDDAHSEQAESKIDALRDALGRLGGPVDLRVYQLDELRAKYGMGRLTRAST